MNRPCIRQHPEPSPANCRACYLFVNDERYRKLWGGMPGLLESASNLATAVIEHTRSGLQEVSEEERQRRLELCEGCPQLTGGRCAACGCFVSLKAKWLSQKCPLGKWTLPLAEDVPANGVFREEDPNPQE